SDSGERGEGARHHLKPLAVDGQRGLCRSYVQELPSVSRPLLQVEDETGTGSHDSPIPRERDRWDVNSSTRNGDDRAEPVQARRGREGPEGEEPGCHPGDVQGR